MKLTQSPKKVLPILVFIAAIAVLFLWAFAFVIVKWWFPHNIEETGTADVFDVLNVLFTALTFISFVWTLWLQRQDLKEQAQDHKEQAQDLKDERIRSRLWGTLPMALELYTRSRPTKHQIGEFNTQVMLLKRERNVEAVGQLAVSNIVVSQALIRLKVFCDLVLSKPLIGFEEDRRAFGTIISATIGLDVLPLLIEIGMRTDQIAFMSLINFLYQYGDLMAACTDEEKSLILANLERYRNPHVRNSNDTNFNS